MVTREVPIPAMGMFFEDFLRFRVLRANDRVTIIEHLLDSGGLGGSLRYLAKSTLALKENLCVLTHRMRKPRGFGALWLMTLHGLGKACADFLTMNLILPS